MRTYFILMGGVTVVVGKVEYREEFKLIITVISLYATINQC